jgi:hypothetical protein
VRRAVGSTAAGRRSGEFKGLSGPASVAQGDFIDELATETRLLAYSEEAFSDDDEDDDDNDDDDDVVNEDSVNVVVDGISMVNFDEIPTKTSTISNVIAQPIVPMADKTTSKEVVNDALLSELQSFEKVVESEVVENVITLDPMLQRVLSKIETLQLT